MSDNSSSSIYVPTVFGTNSFNLKHKNESIFYKQFDGEDSEIVDSSNDTIKIKNHFFVTGESLTYIPPNLGYRVRISPSSPGNTLSTSFLPDEVYPIVVDSEKVRLAFSKQLAIQNEYIDIVGVGTGNPHAFKCEKQNTKCIISIDNIIQSPVSVASTVEILSIVNNTTLELGNLEGIIPGTILKINEEYAKVISVKYSESISGVGTVTLFRGESVLGTPTIEWDNTLSYVSVMSGQYNIVEDRIYFTDAPFEGKKENYILTPEDFSESNFSFNIFNTNIKTGSIIGITTQNPPEGVDSGRFYFAIKNYENNFSFAENYQDAISEVKVEFDMDVGQYDKLKPVGDVVINHIDLLGQSSFSGRAFLRSDYSGNAVFDDISSGFNGISTSFELKTSGISTVGIASDNGVVLINNIFQYPEFEESFVYEEVGGTQTNINFIGIGTDLYTTKDYDVNVKGYPRGGIIIGYGLTGGRNYQPLRQAKLIESFKVEDSGNYIINSGNIGIAYSGSGYRNDPGYAVSVTFEQNGNRIVGYGTGIIQDGYITSINIIQNCEYSTDTDIPNIIIDSPFQYDNIELTGSSNGIGARVSFDISDSGNIVDFKITNPGYGYTVGEILSIPNIVSLSTQVPEDEIKLSVLYVDKDKFSAWNLGNLRKLDDLSSYANGTRKTFNLMENGQLVSIETLPGSPIEVSQTTLVFVNDILQIPDESYFFDGGTQILFDEAPPSGSTIRVYFYTGSEGDTIYNDIDPRVKVGDKVLVKKNIEKNPQTQFQRTVKRILSSDKLKTEIYNRSGLSYDSVTYRPVDITPQSMDLIIGGEIISKSRESLSSKEIGFTSITTVTGTFATAYASTIAINTVGIQTGDYLESIFTDSYQVISISDGVIEISANSTNTEPTTSSISIWRKIE